MLKVTVLCGNPKPGSRTLKIAETLVSRLLPPGGYAMTTIDLAEHAGQIFEWPSDDMVALNQVVVQSDLLVVASPTYKATYTGLLKGFLDRYAADGLAQVVAIPVMTGGDLRHAMGPEVNLRPLLVELGAAVPTRALYFVMSDMEKLEERIDEWIVTNAALLRSSATVAAALPESSADSTALGAQVAR
jgi:FMN reductase